MPHSVRQNHLVWAASKKHKKPKAFRAVGSANGKNPIPIIVPCHRVVAGDGSLGGYSLGLKMKKQLLALEGVSEAE
jgi:methylated-DNA-[protein]-cysteine S-methyltransferase